MNCIKALSHHESSNIRSSKQAGASNEITDRHPSTSRGTMGVKYRCDTALARCTRNSTIHRSRVPIFSAIRSVGRRITIGKGRLHLSFRSGRLTDVERDLRQLFRQMAPWKLKLFVAASIRNRRNKRLIGLLP